MRLKSPGSRGREDRLLGRRPDKKGLDRELRYEGKVLAEDILGSITPARLTEPRVFPGGAGGPGELTNILVHGDNLPVLKTLLDGKTGPADPGGVQGVRPVRLVYIDPPFSTGLGFRTRGEVHAYDDRLSGAGFIEFLRKRLVLLRDLLADDGSIYIHLDWKMAHYMKAVMDEVFGEENFLNDIIWSYGGRGAKAVSRQFPRNHDIILLYRKKAHIFNPTNIEKKIPRGAGGFKQDEKGRWFKTSPRGDYTDESIRGLEKEGRVYKTRNGGIRIKYFLREEGGFIIEEKLVGDVWDDIPDAMHIPAGEKTGYPTQKPESLLGRIIAASTNPGDTVLDCFSGSGTTLVAAEKLGRRWIGMDSGSLAIETTKKRLINIKGTRDIEDPKRKYPSQCKTFAVFET